MNYLKKTIFLSNDEKNKGMATLALENKNNNVFGTIKVYSNIPTGDYVLGIKCNDRIIKQNIKLDSRSYNFILSEKTTLSDTLGCVILKIDGSSISPILWGSERSENYKSKIISTLRDSISKLSQSTYHKPLQSSIVSHKESSSQKNIESEDKVTESQTHLNNLPRRYENINIQMDNIIKETITPTTFTHNHYVHNLNHDTERQSVSTQSKEAYSPIRHQVEVQSHETSTPEMYAQISLDEELISKQNVDEIAIAESTAQLFESNDSEVDNLIDNELKIIQGGKHKFYDMIADQLSELFDRYPREDNLCKLIDNSNWVKINTGIDNKHHVVGIIMYNNDIKYICYGVPGKYNIEPPIEMRDYSQWLPTNTSDPYNMGYWVMYQDADTGENIIVN